MRYALSTLSGCTRRDLKQAENSLNGTVQAYVVPASGQRVPVVVYNIFVGQVSSDMLPC